MKKIPDTHDYTLLRAKFDARLVGRVAPFVAKADIRYYLCGIRVEAAGDRPGVYVVGCDGHQPMVAYDPQGMIENDDGHGIILAMPPAFVRACACGSRRRASRASCAASPSARTARAVCGC